MARIRADKISKHNRRQIVTDTIEILLEDAQKITRTISQMQKAPKLSVHNILANNSSFWREVSLNSVCVNTAHKVDVSVEK